MEGVFSVQQHMLSVPSFSVPEQSGGDLHPSGSSPSPHTLLQRPSSFPPLIQLMDGGVDG